MMNSDGTSWSTEMELFAALPGGRAVMDWFGFVPSFHDAELDRIEVMRGATLMALRTFRMTDAVDAKGALVLDKHAIVTLHLSDVTGVHLVGNAAAILLELGIRRVEAAPPGFGNCGGPTSGDIEVSFETSYGLEGSIFARWVRLSIDPFR